MVQVTVFYVRAREAEANKLSHYEARSSVFVVCTAVRAFTWNLVRVGGGAPTFSLETRTICMSNKYQAARAAPRGPSSFRNSISASPTFPHCAVFYQKQSTTEAHNCGPFLDMRSCNSPHVHIRPVEGTASRTTVSSGGGVDCIRPPLDLVVC